MSFERFNRTAGVHVTGLQESIRAIDNIIRSWGQTTTLVVKETGEFFVERAIGRVHRVSHTLARNISVESSSPMGAIVSARTRYAETEELRPGIRQDVNTPHTYMAPSAAETQEMMGVITQKHFDSLFASNKVSVGAPF